MVLTGYISFLEPHRSCKKCAPLHKSILWNIFVTKKSVLWNIIDTLSPFYSRRSNVHSIFDTSYSFLIWLFTFTAAIVVAFHRDGNSFAFVSSWFSLLSFIIFGPIAASVDTSVKQHVSDMTTSLQLDCFSDTLACR